jgi:hypothetical protein
MANDATLSRRRKMFLRSCVRGNFLDSSGKTNWISISVTRMRFESGFPGRVRFGITTRPNWICSAANIYYTTYSATYSWPTILHNVGEIVVRNRTIGGWAVCFKPNGISYYNRIYFCCTSIYRYYVRGNTNSYAANMYYIYCKHTDLIFLRDIMLAYDDGMVRIIGMSVGMSVTVKNMIRTG